MHKRELDVRGQEFELGELGVGAREEGLLVFFAAEGEEGFFLVTGAEVLLGDVGFAGGDDGDFLLVLVEFVALVFEVEDGSVRGRRCWLALSVLGWMM